MRKLLYRSNSLSYFFKQVEEASLWLVHSTVYSIEKYTPRATGKFLVMYWMNCSLITTSDDDRSMLCLFVLPFFSSVPILLFLFL